MRCWRSAQSGESPVSAIPHCSIISFYARSDFTRGKFVAGVSRDGAEERAAAKHFGICSTSALRVSSGEQAPVRAPARLSASMCCSDLQKDPRAG